jgi:hypothetical protein
MDEVGVSKCCVSGLGELFNFVTNNEVKEAIEKHPDRIIGAVYVRPGFDSPDKIDWAYESGFKVVKITLPSSGYDSPEYYPLWQKCYDYNMPVLFHTGLVTTCKNVSGQGISSWNMHPMKIEPITREFPNLKIIIAHLGVHWNNDAAEIVRMRPNVYVDLSGEPGGWRSRLLTEGLKKYFWWPGAFNKIVFGTDVHYKKIHLALEQDLKFHENANLTVAEREKIFSGNFKNILNQEKIVSGH